MSTPGDPADQAEDQQSPEWLTKRISRLERRLARERSARAEAEEIADRGMRELWLTNRQLDERVAERTADLEATLQELEVASTSRERFLSVLSHEMRTPLNGVLGMLELLDPYTSGDQGARYLLAARESAAGLDNLVRRLLDMVELTTGSMTTSLTTVLADDIVGEVQQRWQTKALRSGHLLSITSFFAGQQLHVDSGRLYQIIDELLENAVTYANPGSLQVRILPSASNVVVEVEDDGPGIDPEILERISSDLNYVDMSTSRVSQGLGLGLALSQRIATALGGELTVESSATGDTSSPAPAHDRTIARLTLPAGLSEDAQAA